MRDKRMEEIKNEIAEIELVYQEYLTAQEQAQKKRAIAQQTGSMDDETLKNMMFDAVNKVLVSDSRNIEIIWKFDDLFAAV